MKILKCLAILPLAFCLFTPVQADVGAFVCPQPSEIDAHNTDPSTPSTYVWQIRNPLPQTLFNLGLGGKTPGPLTDYYTGTNPSTLVCLYRSASHASPMYLAKNIDQVPVKIRPYLKYLRNADSGFIIYALYGPIPPKKS